MQIEPSAWPTIVSELVEDLVDSEDLELDEDHADALTVELLGVVTRHLPPRPVSVDAPELSALIELLTAALYESDNVDEVFSDDVQLHRKMTAAFAKPVTPRPTAVVPAPFVPHPTAPWYDRAIGERGRVRGLHGANADERRSLARYLLEELDSGSSALFSDMVEFYPESFEPYRATILGWDDERLMTFTHHGGSSVLRGVDDNAVDGLFARVPKASDAAKRAWIALLAGIDTDYSLVRLGELGRRSKELRARIAQSCIDVPDAGPAIRRFSPERSHIVAYEKGSLAGSSPGLAYGLPAEEILENPRGVLCQKAPVDAVTIDLSLVAGLPRSALEVQHFLSSNCEECDEWQLGYRYSGVGRVVRILGGADDSDHRKRRQCPASLIEESATGARLGIEAPRWEAGRKRCGAIGGRPRWLQQPEVPSCSGCARLMFFVGEVFAADVGRDDLPDVGMYGFHCAACATAVQVNQFT